MEAIKEEEINYFDAFISSKRQSAYMDFAMDSLPNTQGF